MPVAFNESDRNHAAKLNELSQQYGDVPQLLAKTQQAEADTLTLKQATQAAKDATQRLRDRTSEIAAGNYTHALRIGKLKNPLCHILKKNKLVETLQGALTWNRASSATYADRYGVLKKTLNDEPREEAEGWLIEGASTNLMADSVPTNAEWARARCDIQANATIAPDGSHTASKITATDAGSVYTYRGSSGAMSYVAGTAYTASIYAKAGNISEVQILLHGNAFGASKLLRVDLADGSIIYSTAATVNVTPLADGWYRIEVTDTATATVNSYPPLIYQHPAAGTNVGDYLYVWGCQLEALPFASSYIPSTESFTSRASVATYKDDNGNLQTAGVNVARCLPNYNGVGSGLLFEPAVTNLYAQNYEVSNGTYSHTFISTTNNGVVAANTTLGRLSADTNSASSTLSFRMRSVNCSPSTDYTYSIFLKAGNRRYCAIEIKDNTGAGIVFGVDMQDGLVTNGGHIEAYADGVWRVWGTMKTGAGASSFNAVNVHYADRMYDGSLLNAYSATDYFYIGNWQMELVTRPTSWIKADESVTSRSADVSSSAATTRAADDVSIPWEGNKTFDEYTVTTKFSLISPEEVAASANGRKYLYNLTGLTIDTAFIDSIGTRLFCYGGTDVHSNANAHEVFASGSHQAAVVRGPFQISAFANGAIGTSDKRVTNWDSTPAGVIFVGQVGGSRYLWGHLHDFRIYDFALTSDEIALLSGE